MRIESYDFGRLVVDGREYRSDVILRPDRIDASWRREEGHELRPADIRGIVESPPEVLVVGCGAMGALSVRPETAALLKEKGVELRVHNTDVACRVYNELSAAGRKVSAALHLTC
ncbi:MAG: hypothetical protein HY922_12080 [Elusimicrobia bacterium]|nr:hypothetical protein [Elusimicrobiota bacterium]